MIVLIDNYDSFSYNLYQLLGQFDPDITVIRNDEKTVQDIEAMHPDHLIISPGPGRPADAGVCEEAISYFAGKVPILGVCLGHQAICEIYGGTITYAKQLMHGKQSVATLKTDSPLFKGLPEQVDVGYAARRIGSPGPYGRRRNHGRRSQAVSRLRPAVPSRIDFDAPGADDGRKFPYIISNIDDSLNGGTYDD